MHRFEDLDQVQSALQKLMQREPPLVKVLPRQPGTKESRYVHLLSGEVEGAFIPEPHYSASAVSPDSTRLARLEEEVGELKSRLQDLQQQMSDFRKQFE
jgi:hypothetical protein